MSYRAIVVGLGGLGSAALHRLAADLGPGVLGIEQFELGHHRGASQDHSRTIRLAHLLRPQIVVAIGAGHAYEFAALIGGLLADLAQDRAPAHPIDAFSITRPALTDPSFPRSFHV